MAENGVRCCHLTITRKTSPEYLHAHNLVHEDTMRLGDHAQLWREGNFSSLALETAPHPCPSNLTTFSVAEMSSLLLLSSRQLGRSAKAAEAYIATEKPHRQETKRKIIIISQASIHLVTPVAVSLIAAIAKILFPAIFFVSMSISQPDSQRSVSCHLTALSWWAATCLSMVPLSFWYPKD